MTAAVALLASACVQPEIKEATLRPDQGFTLKVGLPNTYLGIEVTQGADKAVADEIMEQLSIAAAESRVNCDADAHTFEGAEESTLVWTTGDIVGINAGRGVLYTGSDGAPGYQSDPLNAMYDGQYAAEFFFQGADATEINKMTNVTVVYPHNIIGKEGQLSLGVTPSELVFKLPSEQIVPAGNSIGSGAVGKNGVVLIGNGKIGETIDLEHMCAYIAIPIQKSGSTAFDVTSVELISRGGEALCGDFKACKDTSGNIVRIEPYVANADVNGGDSATLATNAKNNYCNHEMIEVTHASGKFTWNSSNMTTVIVAIPAPPLHSDNEDLPSEVYGKYTYDKGFTVSVNTTQGSIQKTINKDANNDKNSVNRQNPMAGRLYVMPTLTLSAGSGGNLKQVTSPQRITSASQYVAFVNAVNAGDGLSGYDNWKQPNGEVWIETSGDLDLSGVTVPTMNVFKGVLNGRGKKITYANMDGKALIDLLDGGTVKNIVFGESCKLKYPTPRIVGTDVSQVSSPVRFGFITRENDGGVISGCVNNAHITMDMLNTSANASNPEDLRTQMRCGAFVGQAYRGARMINCVNNGNITITLQRITNKKPDDSGHYNSACTQYIGGLQGAQTNAARSGTNEGSLTTEISNCYNNGNIEIYSKFRVSHGVYVGGVSGSVNERSDIYRCTNTGHVFITFENGMGSQVTCGGVVGYAAGKVVDCHFKDNSGAVTQTWEYEAGGTTKTASVERSGVDIRIDGPVKSTAIGGVVGYLNNEISNCTNTSRVTIDFGYYNGGQTIGGVHGRPKSDAFEDNSNDKAVSHYYAHVTIGGIAGLGFTGRGQTEWMEVKNCVNRGRVSLLYRDIDQEYTAKELSELTNAGGEPVPHKDDVGWPCVGGIIGAPWGRGGRVGYDVEQGNHPSPRYSALVEDIADCTNYGTIRLEYIEGSKAIKLRGAVGGIAGADLYSAIDYDIYKTTSWYPALNDEDRASVDEDYANKDGLPACLQNTCNIVRCHNRGSIGATARNKSNSLTSVGGIVGWPGCEQTYTRGGLNVIADCTNKGNVFGNGAGTFRVGGIAGGTGNIVRCKTFRAGSNGVGGNSTPLTSSCYGGVQGFHSQNHDFIDNYNYENVYLAAKSGNCERGHIGGMVGLCGNSTQTLQGGAVCTTLKRLNDNKNQIYWGVIAGGFNGKTGKVTVKNMKVKGTTQTMNGTDVGTWTVADAANIAATTYDYMFGMWNKDTSTHVIESSVTYDSSLTQLTQ